MEEEVTETKRQVRGRRTEMERGWILNIRIHTTENGDACMANKNLEAYRSNRAKSTKKDV